MTGPTRRTTEWLEPPPSRRRTWPVLLLIGAVVALVTVAIVRPGDPAPPQPNPAPTPVGVPVVTTAAPLFATSRSWEIVAYGAETGLVRLTPTTGETVRTPLPRWAGSDTAPAVALIARRGYVVVARTDGTGTAVVVDGAPARVGTEALAQPTHVFPGPADDQVWAVSSRSGAVPGSNRLTVALTDLTGRRFGPTLAVPPQGSDAVLHADATGYVLATGVGGIVRIDPDGARQVTSGTVVAVGPTRWLTTDCDTRPCGTWVTDRTEPGAARRALAGIRPLVGAATGLVSPDGRWACLVAIVSGTAQVVVVDLATGRVRPTELGPAQLAGDGTVWAPDSQRLISLAPAGGLVSVDPTTGRSVDLATGLRDLTAVTVRPR